MRRWIPKSVQSLFQHPLLSLERHHLVAAGRVAKGPEAGGDEREAIVLNTPDWVNVVPLLPDGRVVLVRQWRYGLQQLTVEIPGGIVEPGEEERAAAERELLEETGYRAGTWRRLGEVHPNPAIQTNLTGTWLATDLEKLGPAEGDGQEELEPLSVPLEEIPAWIASGRISHSLVVAAFYLLGLGGDESDN